MAGTRWVRLDTGYLRNPKVLDVSTAAVLVHLASVLYSADQLTDGAVPAGALSTLTSEARVPSNRGRAVADDLVDARLWVPNGRGWYVHDFDEMNPQALRDHVEAERERWRRNSARRRAER